MPTSAELILAIITFILSSLLGALFGKWLSRPKPKLVITSVGFQGSSQLIQVPEKLITISDTSAWVNPLMSYANYDDLIKQHREVSETIQRLKKANELAKRWLNDNQGRESDFRTINEIRKHPYVIDDTIGLAITRMIRRDEFNSIPITLKDLNSKQEIAELIPIDDIGGWHLLLGSKTIVFSTKEKNDKVRKDSMKLFAESFSHGCIENIFFYTKAFVNTSNEEIIMLSEYRNLLEEILLPEARLFVELSIYNSGQSAIAMRPHMGLKILHPKLQEECFILTIQKKRQDGKENEIRTISPARIGVDVVPDSFLPGTSASPYTSIRPGEMREIALIACEPLGKERGETVMSIYQTGLLKCKVAGQTIKAHTVWSAPATFSRDISTDEKTALERIISRKALLSN
jgi:hypothetical protein